MATLLETASLVMVPSGYEDGTLGGLVPTDASGDFTFTRGSNLSATRVNEQGLIEKGYENLLTYSNDFSNAAWVKSGSPTVTPGQVGYDGSNSAWLLTTYVSTNYLRQSISLSSVITYSVYAKAGSAKWINLFRNGTDVSIYFDLENGVASPPSSSSGFAYGMNAVGNDWYRCWVALADSTSDIRIFAASGNNARTAGTLYIQDAQLNQGLVVYPYIETTTAPEKGGILADLPRVDYSSGKASLLLEPQRTNLFAGSEYLTGWANIGLSPEYNYGISPEGVKNSVKLTGNGNAGDRIEEVVTLSAGVDYTFSMYIKNVDSVRNIIFGTTESFFYDIDWNGAEISSVTAGLNYESVGNGWYRIWETSQSDSSSIFRVYPSRTGPYDKSIEIYGLQLEEATYPTSYIPTYGTSQTRLKDVLLEGTAGLSNFFNPTEGALFFEVDEPLFRQLTSDGRSIAMRDTATGERFQLRGRSNSVYFLLTMCSPNVVSIANFENNTKYVIKWNGSEVKMFANGEARGSSPQINSFRPNTLGVATGFGMNTPTGEKFTNITCFPTALSDEACIELTTL